MVSLGVGFMGSFVMAKLTGVHRPSGGVEPNRGVFSVLWMWARTGKTLEDLSV